MLTVKVVFVDGKFVKELYSNSIPAADSVARFIVWRNETVYTETTITEKNGVKTYTITVQ